MMSKINSDLSIKYAVKVRLLREQPRWLNVLLVYGIMKINPVHGISDE